MSAEGINGVYGIRTSRGVYLTAYSQGMVHVRLLGHLTDPAGTWVEVAPFSADWQEAGILVVKGWEQATQMVKLLYHKDREKCWKHALQLGDMVLDYYLEGHWYCLVVKPKEIC